MFIAMETKTNPTAIIRTFLSNVKFLNKLCKDSNLLNKHIINDDEDRWMPDLCLAYLFSNI